MAHAYALPHCIHNIISINKWGVMGDIIRNIEKVSNIV